MGKSMVEQVKREEVELEGENIMVLQSWSKQTQLDKQLTKYPKFLKT